MTLDPGGIGPEGGMVDWQAHQDPWALLHAVRGVDLAERAAAMPQFLTLVAKREPTEQDALLESGREVFRYRLETARKSLKAAISTGGAGVAVAAATVYTPEWLAEMVYRPGTVTPLGYLVHHLDGSTNGSGPTWQETVRVGAIQFAPPDSRLVDAGVVLIPEGVAEYGDDRDLFLALRSFVGRYLHLESMEYRTIAVCYVLMSWLFDRFDALPYLRVQGDLGTGKTRFLQTMGALCYRPVMAGGATTPSPVFRIIDKFRGTVVIDEADFDKSDMWSEIVKILNCGYSRGWPVLRTERDSKDGDLDVRAYDCYSPKLLATRRRFADAALESRCLSYTMPILETLERRVPLVVGREFWAQATALRSQLLLWRFRHWATAQVNPEDVVPGAEPRVNQVAQPLLASIWDAHLRDTILKSVESYSKVVQSDRRDSAEGAVLGVLVQRWEAKGRPEELLLREVTERLAMEHESLQLTARKVGDVVRRVLGLETTIRGGNAWVKIHEKTLTRVAGRYGIVIPKPTKPAPEPVDPEDEWPR